ncbi:filamentous hemagglutinin N-terminal domain-containing protein [Erythrobacter sp. JK5]|uniref:beta strand repeat-containing protein n=1 Tax=Erythrobacter sp. JK5 TaxID=2829500 RepID=UPI001BAE411E|nr:filamentous hemagglutinin N-terminal domain-containing protein [Erythrobacter sp. JK5]QUL36792.1 filamentous hemagglutinin N-terminal domain-containing protein [Erythrobacter sp. JK5]
MAVASRKFRSRMLMTTAVAAIAALPNVAHAQLVRQADLSSAVDSGGTPNRLTVTDTNATTTDIEVEAAVVVAEWTDFNVGMGDTVNVTIDPGLALSEATLFNRVIGGNPSSINGTINAANINFWLINQNGILFGNDTAINARSFFASTLDVANQDIFDFYEATDVFGNGTNTLNFAGVSTSAVQALGNASFVTDGSLAFVSQQLNLTGSFDAGTGRAIFVTAADVDVSFTPGSPLTYTVNAGTTVAAQSIDGSIQGASAEFAMFTAAGVINALLDIDATVAATTALATDTGIALVASGPSTATVEIGGQFSSTGRVVLNSNGDLTATANISGSDLDLDAVGAVSVVDLTATGGDLDIDAASITGTDFLATGDIVLDSAGAVSLQSATADSDTSGAGDLLIGTSTVPSGVTATFDLSGANTTLQTSGSLNLAVVTATAGDVTLEAVGDVFTNGITALQVGMVGGNIDVDSTAGGTLVLGALGADGDIALDTTGALTTDSINSGGALTVGAANAPSSITFNGNVIVESMDLDTPGAVNALDLIATAGDIVIDPGSLTAGALSATGNINIDTAGTVTLTSATADSDLNDAGDLLIGTITPPSLVTITGASAGDNVTMNATTLNLGNVTATRGNTSLSGTTINAAAVSAVRGDVSLQAIGNITTTAITATRVMGTGGDIDVDSTGGGNLNLGDLTARRVFIDTLGTLTTGDINAPNGQINIGLVNMPSNVNITGAQTAAEFIINVVTAYTSGDLTATNGEITINAPSIDTGHLSATGGDVTLNAPGFISALSIESIESGGMGGAIDVDSTLGGAVTLGPLTSDGLITLDTTGNLVLGEVNAGGALDIGSTAFPATTTFNGNITAASFAFSTFNPLVLLDVTTTDGDLILFSPTITAGAVSATGGDATLSSFGNITTTSIAATEAGGLGGNIDVDSGFGGALDVGNLTATNDIALDTTGTLTLGDVVAGGNLLIGVLNQPSTITLNGNLTAASLAFNTTAPFVANDLTATAGDIDIDAPTITAGAVSATGGDVLLTATGAITTTSITAIEAGLVGGNIDVDSTAGGALVLGDLGADNAIALDTTGTLSAGTVNAGGALTVGGVAIPSSINFTGNVAAGSMNLDTTGTFMSQDLSAPLGAIDVFAGSTITTGAVTADQASLIGTGTVQTGNVTVNQSLALTATGGSLTTGNVVANNIGSGVSLRASGATSDITSGSINSNGGDILVSAARNVVTGPVSTALVGAPTAGSIGIHAGGSITTAILSAGEDLLVQSVGSTVSLAGATVGDDAIIRAAGAIDLLGPVTADGTGVDFFAISFFGAPGASSLLFAAETLPMSNIDIDTPGALTATDLTASAGGIDIDAGSIIAAVVSTTGGDAQLTSAGNTTTTSITSVTSGGGGSIDVDSTAGGALNLGVLTADSGIAIDTTGSLATGAVNAGGALNVGSAAAPQTISLADNVAAASVTLRAAVSVAAQDITATAGLIDIDANQQVLGALSATGNVELDGGTSISAASVTADSDTNGTGAVAIGGTTAPVTLTIAGTTEGAGVSARAGTTNLADVTSSAGSIALAATSGGLTTANVVSNGLGSSVTLNSSGISGDITTGTVNANSGDIFVSASGDIASGAVSTALAGVPTAGTIGLHAGGSVATGQLSAGEDLRIETVTGTVTIPGATAGDDIVIDAGGAVDLQGAVSADGSGVDLFAPSFLGAPGTSVLVFAAETLPGSAIVIDTTGALTGTTLTASAGGIDLDAASIALGAVSATGGDAQLTASGGITTTSITAVTAGSGGGIDVDSTAGGALALGDLTADTGIALDTTGTLAAGTVTAGGALTVGATALPSAVTFTGNVAAASMDIDATGALAALNLTASAGNIDIDTGSIAAQAVAATGNVALDAAGTISLTSAVADSDASGAGDLAIGGTTTPSQLTITGASSGVNAALNATTMNVTTVTATGGDAALIGGTLTATVVQATNDVTADATTAITLDTVTADSDMNGMGDVRIGTVTRPGLLTINTSVSGANVTLEADDLNLINGLSTNGNLTLRANTIDLTDVVATGGNAVIEASGDVTTGSITATAVGMVGGGIDVDSTGGGALDLGDLTAGAGITLDTTGSLTADTVAAGGALQIGATAAPGAVTLTGNATAASMAVASTGTLTAQNLTATAGAIDLDAAAISAQAVAATGTVTADAAGAVALASAVADSDMNGTGDLAIGAVTAPSSVTVAGAASGVNLSVQSGGAIGLGSAAATGGNALIAGGSVASGATTASGDLTIDAAGAVVLASAIADSDANGAGDLSIGTTTAPSALTISGAASGVNATLASAGTLTGDAITATGGNASLTASEITVGAVSAAGGDALLQSGGAITTASISATAGGAIDVDSTAGGALDLGDLTASADIALDTTGAIAAGGVSAGGALRIGDAANPTMVDFTGDVTAASVGVTAIGELGAQDVTATAGAIEVDAAAIAAGAMAATGAIRLDADGAIALASAAADSDNSGAGDISIGTVTPPTDLTVAGAVSGANVALTSAGGISTDALTTNGGDATIEAADGVSLASIGARELAITTGGLLSVGAISTTGRR